MRSLATVASDARGAAAAVPDGSPVGEGPTTEASTRKKAAACPESCPATLWAAPMAIGLAASNGKTVTEHPIGSAELAHGW
jgi:hypothetical protein